MDLETILSELGHHISASTPSVKYYRKPGDPDWTKAFERASKTGLVLVPAGIYEVNRAEIGPFTTIVGTRNSIIQSTPDDKEYHENFRVNGDVMIAGLSFNGRLNSLDWQGGNPNQGDYWHLEHRCAIRAKDGEVTVRDCTFTAYPGDGIYCRDETELLVSGCRGWNVFRGLVTIGGRCKAILSDLWASGDRQWPCGIYIETHGRAPVDVQMDNIAIRGRFKVECTPGSRIICNNVRSTLDGHVPHSQNWSVNGTGDMIISNSYFEGHDFKLNGAGRMLITGCQFRSKNFPGKEPCNGLRWKWDNEGDRDPENHLLQISNCQFYGEQYVDTLRSMPEGIHSSTGLLSDAKNEPAKNNRLVVDNCTIDGYDVGMSCARGANWVVRNSHISCTKPVTMRWKPGSRGIRALFDGITLGKESITRPPIEVRPGDNVNIAATRFFSENLAPVPPL